MGIDSMSELGLIIRKPKTDLARDLRKENTDAERILWRELRGKKLDGFKFHRQYLIGKYIVDFVNLKNQLVIEVDGGGHVDQEDYDRERDQWFNEHGYSVLRFWNNEIFKNTEGVLEVIRNMLSTKRQSN